MRRMFLQPLGVIDLVASQATPSLVLKPVFRDVFSQLLTRVMNAYLTKRMPDQDKFLRRFMQPSYCTTAGHEIAAFEQGVMTVRKV
jgi:hypothetical protein